MSFQLKDATDVPTSMQGGHNFTAPDLGRETAQCSPKGKTEKGYMGSDGSVLLFLFPLFFK